MFCTNCGSNITDDAIFCENCGTKVTENDNEQNIETQDNNTNTAEPQVIAEDIPPAPAQEKYVVCKSCGSQIPEDEAFCTNCGQAVQTEENANAELVKAEENIPPAPVVVEEIVPPAPVVVEEIIQLAPVKSEEIIPPAPVTVEENIPPVSEESVFCTNCGAKILEGTKFCGSCGRAVPAAEQATPIEKRCVSCGTIIQEGVAFCTNCGTSVQQTNTKANYTAPTNQPQEGDKNLAPIGLTLGIISVVSGFFCFEDSLVTFFFFVPAILTGVASIIISAILILRLILRNKKAGQSIRMSIVMLVLSILGIFLACRPIIFE